MCSVAAVGHVCPRRAPKSDGDNTTPAVELIWAYKKIWACNDHRARSTSVVAICSTASVCNGHDSPVYTAWIDPVLPAEEATTSPVCVAYAPIAVSITIPYHIPGCTAVSWHGAEKWSICVYLESSGIPDLPAMSVDDDRKDQKVGMASGAMEDTASVSRGKVICTGSSTEGGDVAAKYANVFTDGETYSASEWGRLRWKLDLRFVPLLWFNVTLGAMDKVTTATAALYGFREDTGLTGDRYSWVGSAFYFGYLVWCIPSGTLLQKFPVAKLMFAAQLIWGVILVATGFAHNFATLISLRVLLGALEAPVVPGNLLVMSMWYTRREQPIRTGLMYTGLSVCFTGPIGWGIGFLSGEHRWRAMFWITGGVTIVWACVVGIFLPDSPVEAKFVTERQKAIVIDRLRADQTGVENKNFRGEQVVEALTDPKTWLMFLFNIFISIPNGGLTNFSPLIIQGLGYSSQRSTLLTMPTGIIQTMSSYICNGGVFLCAKYLPQRQCRVAWVLFGIVVGLISAVFLYTLPLDDYLGRLAALYMSYFYLGPYIVCLGMNTANTAGHTKKVTVNAIIFLAYCTSNIIGPQFFRAAQAPLYPLGMAAILGSYVLSIITVMTYALYCWRENARRDRVDEAAGAAHHDDTDFRDLTDKQNIHFRYVW
ncbi:Allantoate permease [Geosmithia morbida]|uniref:Allantoate permease n=1 Tax=Geosmithia morbida TaxID=1094350 RepID=A0A9P4YUR1_9HYPO|nr:Allantoate permease [Geosmithia morbida]KAF4121379.1 Allantoate permease [Geosmithia morbida]